MVAPRSRWATDGLRLASASRVADARFDAGECRLGVAGGQVVRAERNGRLTTTTYDTLGRKLSTTDPDTGAWTYVVNDAGETIAQNSPRGYCTQQRYDGRGRVWQRNDYPGACGTGSASASATWQFDTALYGRGKSLRSSPAKTAPCP